MSARWQEDRLAPLVKLGADIDERIGHAAMLEAAAVPDELVRWLVKVAASGRLTGEDVYQLERRGIAIEPGAYVDRGIDHAVALEREAITGWLERLAFDEYRHAATATTQRMKQACRDEAHACERAAHAIRNGAHNPQHTTSGDSRGPGVPQVPEGAPRPSTDANGPEMAETGMDSCRPSPESEDA